MGTSPVEILVVEDSVDQVLLLKLLFGECKTQANISVVRDGAEAADYLNKRGRYGAVRTPNLILLDLQLPKKSGAELLREIKCDLQLGNVPVIVLSAHASIAELVHQTRADSYYQKPSNLNLYRKVVNDIESRFLAPLH